MRWEEGMLRHIEHTSDKHIDIKETEIGKIISLSPFQIDLGGLPLYPKNIYIDYALLEHVESFTNLTGGCSKAGVNISISNGTISFKSQLKKNDLVAVRKMNNDKYLVINKIVRGDSI